MRVDRLSEPAALITVDTALSHLRRSDGDSEGWYIESLIGAATARAEAYLFRPLMPRALALVLDAFPEGTIELPQPPCISVTSVQYLDAGGTLQTLPPSDYIVSLPTGPKALRARVAPVTSWPTTKAVMDAVTITYTAGYSTIPTVITQAVLMLIAALDLHRGDDTTDESPDLRAVYHLLEPFKVFE